MKKILWLILAMGLAAIVAVVVLFGEREGGPAEDVRSKSAAPVDATPPSRQDGGKSSSARRAGNPVSAGEADANEPQEEPQTEEEKAAAAAEAKVEAFDNLTDKWMEASKTGVTMKDVESFCKAFRSVPKDRKDECVHRALNLIPDENVMLLAGILMDKTMDKEIVETVFNDILNRDEDVKKPIMKEIFKDKTHPCWVDVAWIFDVTGENEKKQ